MNCGRTLKICLVTTSNQGLVDTLVTVSEYIKASECRPVETLTTKVRCVKQTFLGVVAKQNSNVFHDYLNTVLLMIWLSIYFQSDDVQIRRRVLARGISDPTGS